MNFTINQIVEHSLVAFILKYFVSSNENETRVFFRYIKRGGKGGVVICDLAYIKVVLRQLIIGPAVALPTNILLK